MFLIWDNKIHSQEDQIKRQERAKKEKMIFQEFNEQQQNAIIGSANSSTSYNVSLFSCSCKDFSQRKLPCKHMYALANRLEEKGLSPFDRDISLPKNFVILDIETTGLYPTKHEIAEISIIKIQDGSIIEEFSSLIKIEGKMSDDASKVNGITNEMLKDAPLPLDVFKQAKSFIGDNIIIGHNVNFDLSFLGTAFAKYLDFECEYKYIDTMRLAKNSLKQKGQKYKLEILAEQFDIQVEHAHRALSDCHTTFELLKKLSYYVENINFYIREYKYNDTEEEDEEISSDIVISVKMPSAEEIAKRLYEKKLAENTSVIEQQKTPENPAAVSKTHETDITKTIADTSSRKKVNTFFEKHKISIILLGVIIACVFLCDIPSIGKMFSLIGSIALNAFIVVLIINITKRKKKKKKKKK